MWQVVIGDTKSGVSCPDCRPGTTWPLSRHGGIAEGSRSGARRAPDSSPRDRAAIGIQMRSGGFFLHRLAPIARNPWRMLIHASRFSRTPKTCLRNGDFGSSPRLAIEVDPVQDTGSSGRYGEVVWLCGAPVQTGQRVVARLSESWLLRWSKAARTRIDAESRSTPAHPKPDDFRRPALQDSAPFNAVPQYRPRACGACRTT